MGTARTVAGGVAIVHSAFEDPATPYYLLWLTAAENLVTARGLLDAEQLAVLRQAESPSTHSTRAAHACRRSPQRKMFILACWARAHS